MDLIGEGAEQQAEEERHVRDHAGRHGDGDWVDSLLDEPQPAREREHVRQGEVERHHDGEAEDHQPVQHRAGAGGLAHGAPRECCESAS